MKNLGHSNTFRKWKKRRTFLRHGWKNKEDLHNFNHTANRELRLNLHHSLCYILNYLDLSSREKLNNKGNFMKLNVLDYKYYCNKVINSNHDYFQRKYSGLGATGSKKNNKILKLNMIEGKKLVSL